jgi:hypothetical protein
VRVLVPVPVLASVLVLVLEPPGAFDLPLRAVA